MRSTSTSLLSQALSYSFPVFLGYITSGIAFGLVMSDTGYPWYIAALTSIVMYAGSGQFTAAALFANAVTPLEAAFVQFVINARHAAYGITLFKQIKNAGKYSLYLIYSLSDETFALHASMSDDIGGGNADEKSKFMFFTALLDQSYWVLGTLLGAIAGELIPVPLDGIDFALTALFIVLTIEQYYRIKKFSPFIITMCVSILCILFIPSRLALIAAIIVSLCSVQFMDNAKNPNTRNVV